MAILLIIIGIILAIIGGVIFCEEDSPLGILIGSIAGGITGLGILIIFFM